jgi:hypothetical protein
MKKLLRTHVQSAVQMKTTSLLTGIFLIFLLLSPSATALFTSSHTLKGTLTENTEVFFIGKTSIDGSFTGQPMENLVNSSLVQDMGGFPLIGASSITNLDTVIVAEDIDITTATSLEDLIAHYFDHLISYSDVDITMDNGLFVLGINQGNMSLSSDLSYAVTTIVPLEIIPGTITRFFFIGTNSPLTMHCSGDFAVLTTLSDTSTIQIKGRNGETLWTGGSPNDYFIIQDTSFSLTKNPSLSLFPLSNTTSTLSLTVSVSPAAPTDVRIQQLIQNVSEVVGYLEDSSASEFLRNINDLDNYIQTTSFIANGAMVFLRTNDSVTIDHSTQRFSSTGFVRFNTLDITKFGSSVGPTLKADSTLCYLGDHFYNPSAKRSIDGIAFPFELLFIWILALCVFVYIRFFLRPPVDITLDEKVKRYALYFHLVVLVIAFLLLDMEINLLFGISALTALLSQGFSMITGSFFLLELIIWVFGYLMLAIPLQLLSSAILRFLGIGKGGNGIWKAVGDLSIWVFCGFYLLLLFNILFSLIDFNSLFPLG